MPTITARRLVTDIGSIEFPVLTVSDEGTLADISSDPRALAHEQDTLTAAFFDIHTHGAKNHDVMSATPTELSEMQRFLATRGIAQYLPTTVTASIDATLRALDALANAIESAPGEHEARPLGIHLEGPFLSHARRGVHPPDKLQPPSIELFDRFQQAARGHIRLLTIAPEPNAWLPTQPVRSNEPRNAEQPVVILSEASQLHRDAESKDPEGVTPIHSRPDLSPQKASPSALDLIRHATSQGVRVSLGHTNALAAEARTAIDAGASSATHTFNAMRALDHREPGVLGVVLDDNRLFAELICDGIHVDPSLVRLWLKAKGRDRAILVTDAMSAAGMPEGNYKLGDLDVSVADGRAFLSGDLDRGKHTLAGSVLTMDRAVANVQSFTGATLADATRFASHNPAAMLGQPELTRLAPGSPASLNRFDAQGRLLATYVRGKHIPAS